MSLLRVLDPTLYRRCNWRFVIQSWTDAVGQLAAIGASVAIIAAALRYLAS